jgi:hypothetical protein
MWRWPAQNAATTNETCTLVFNDLNEEQAIVEEKHLALGVLARILPPLLHDVAFHKQPAVVVFAFLNWQGAALVKASLHSAARR